MKKHVEGGRAMSEEPFALAQRLAQLAADIEGLPGYTNRTHPDISNCVVKMHDLAQTFASDRAGEIYDETDEG